MHVYIKKLQNQESGYSGDKPNQRGKYILLSTDAWDFFPNLSAGTRNSFCSLRIQLPNHAWIGVLYVWHNTKFFPEAGLDRDHNERRIYRNNSLETSLNLDRDVILCLGKPADSEFDFYSVSIQPSDPEYQSVSDLIGKNSSIIIDIDGFRAVAPTASAVLLADEALPRGTPDSTKSIENASELITEAQRRLETGARNRVTIAGDPYEALLSSFKTQADFSEAVRVVYSGKCALRDSCIYKDHPIGLEAAHIHAKHLGGNNLPTNGILLSTDLHRAFDEGVWTLDDELKVIVHEAITDGIMAEFSGMRINIPEDNLSLKPFIGYVTWHRENIFGHFQRLTAS